jgi:hypothetical protein
MASSEFRPFDIIISNYFKRYHRGNCNTGGTENEERTTIGWVKVNHKPYLFRIDQVI